MIGPRTYLVGLVLAIGAVCWGLGFGLHGLPGEDWMNWKGWGWIFTPITLAIGIAQGWDWRGMYERHLRVLEEIRRRRGQP